MKKKIKLFSSWKITFSQIKDSHQGWQAYAKWANSYKLRGEMKNKIIEVLWERI